MKVLAVLLALVLLLLTACSAAPTATSGLRQELRTSDSRGAPAAAPGGGTGAGPATSGDTAAQPWDRMIIRDVSLTLQVKDVEQALAGVRGIVVSAGGVVTKSNTSSKGDDMIATLTVQVPTRSFDPVIQSLRQLAVKVESEVGTSQDITDEFVDLDSQVRNLQATETQLLRVMEKANTITDILSVQRELTSVRGQIEKAQGRMNFLKQRSDMATINISLKTPPAVEKKENATWDPGDTARKTWEQSMSFWRVVIDLAIALAVFFWWLVPVGVIAGLIIRWEQRKRAKAG